MIFEVVQRAVVLTDLVDSVGLTSMVGDLRYAELMAGLDSGIRGLIRQFGGREIDKTDGFLVVFGGCVDALDFALALNSMMEKLSAREGVELRVRTGLHYGNLVLRENPAEAVAEGAKSLDADGLTKVIAARVSALGEPGQVLITRTLFDLIREDELAQVRFGDEVRWLAHGPYLLQGLGEPVEIFEVGYEGRAPLRPPVDKQKARRAILPQDEVVLGWRPAAGQIVPSATDWRVVKKLGEGGYGEVWLAEHQRTSDRRVFKFCFDASRIRSLNREKFLLGIIQENLGKRDDIVSIEDWNTDVFPFFIALEYIPLANMATWLDKGGKQRPLSERTILSLVRKTAVALEAAHSVGVLHKDIKPSNVLVGGEGEAARVYLIDFGVGLYAPSAEGGGATSSSSSSSDSEQTTLRTSSLAGSRIYVAPEVAEGKLPSVQADLFSLGVLLYQLLRDDLTMALKVGWERDIGDSFIVQLIAGATDGDLEKRFRSVSEFIRQIDSMAERRSEAALRQRAASERRELARALARQKRRRILYATGLAITIPLVCVSGVFAVKAHRSSVTASAKAEEATDAKDRANELISFMLEDLTGELRRTGQLPLMDKVTSRALAYYESETSETLTLSGLYNRGKGYALVGEILHDQHKMEEAAGSLERAERIARRLTAAYPQERKYRKLLSEVVFLNGAVADKLGDRTGASDNYNEALALRERLYEEKPRDYEAVIVLANTYNAISLREPIPADARLSERALEITRKAVEDAQASAEVSPAELELLERKQADCLFYFARNGPGHGPRREAIKEAVAISERLHRKNPENYLHATALLEAYTLAGRHRLCCRPEDAVPFLEKAEELADQLLKRDPTNLEWQQYAARTKAAFGIALGGSGKTTGALEAARSAEKLLADLLIDNPKHKVVWTTYVDNYAQYHATLGMEEMYDEQRKAMENTAQVLERVVRKVPEEDYVGKYLEMNAALSVMTGDKGYLTTAVDAMRNNVMRSSGEGEAAEGIENLVAGMEALLETDEAFATAPVKWNERDLLNASGKRQHLMLSNVTDEVFVVRLFEQGSDFPFMCKALRGKAAAERNLQRAVNFCPEVCGISINGSPVKSLERVATQWEHDKRLINFHQLAATNEVRMKYRAVGGRRGAPW